MHYQLKKGVESFEVVDGAFAGKRYLRGKVYEKIPPEEKHKFEKIPVEQAFQPAISQQTGKPDSNQQTGKPGESQQAGKPVPQERSKP